MGCCPCGNVLVTELDIFRAFEELQTDFGGKIVHKGKQMWMVGACAGVVVGHSSFLFTFFSSFYLTPLALKRDRYCSAYKMYVLN